MNCPNCNVLLASPVPANCPACHLALMPTLAAMQMPRLVGTFGCNNNAQPQVVVAQSSTPWWAWLILAFTVVGAIVGAGLWIHWGVQGSTTDEVVAAATVINGHTTATVNADGNATRAALATSETNLKGAITASEGNVKSAITTDGNVTRGAVATSETNVKGAITASETAVKAAVSADGNATRTELADARKAMRRAIFSRASKSDVQAAEAGLKAAMSNQKITVKVVH